MIGMTLQDRKAGDVEALLNGVVSVFRITTDEDSNHLFKIEIGFDIHSFDTIFKILNLIREYMEGLENE